MGPARAHPTRPPSGYPSDLADAQWQVIAAHLPGYAPGRRGRPPVWPARTIVNAILYVDRTGCAWRYLPGDLPPWQTLRKAIEADDVPAVKTGSTYRIPTAWIRQQAGMDGGNPA